MFVLLKFIVFILKFISAFFVKFKKKSNILIKNFFTKAPKRPLPQLKTKNTRATETKKAKKAINMSDNVNPLGIIQFWEFLSVASDQHVSSYTSMHDATKTQIPVTTSILNLCKDNHYPTCQIWHTKFGKMIWKEIIFPSINILTLKRGSLYHYQKKYASSIIPRVLYSLFGVVRPSQVVMMPSNHRNESGPKFPIQDSKRTDKMDISGFCSFCGKTHMVYAKMLFNVPGFPRMTFNDIGRVCIERYVNIFILISMLRDAITKYTQMSFDTKSTIGMFGITSREADEICGSDYNQISRQIKICFDHLKFINDIKTNTSEKDNIAIESNMASNYHSKLLQYSILSQVSPSSPSSLESPTSPTLSPTILPHLAKQVQECFKDIETNNKHNKNICRKKLLCVEEIKITGLGEQCWYRAVSDALDMEIISKEDGRIRAIELSNILKTTLEEVKDPDILFRIGLPLSGPDASEDEMTRVKEDYFNHNHFENCRWGGSLEMYLLSIFSQGAWSFLCIDNSEEPVKRYFYEALTKTTNGESDMIKTRAVNGRIYNFEQVEITLHFCSYMGKSNISPNHYNALHYRYDDGSTSKVWDRSTKTSNNENKDKIEIDRIQKIQMCCAYARLNTAESLNNKDNPICVISETNSPNDKEKQCEGDSGKEYVINDSDIIMHHDITSTLTNGNNINQHIIMNNNNNTIEKPKLKRAKRKSTCLKSNIQNEIIDNQQLSKKKKKRRIICEESDEDNTNKDKEIKENVQKEDKDKDNNDDNNEDADIIITKEDINGVCCYNDIITTNPSYPEMPELVIPTTLISSEYKFPVPDVPPSFLFPIEPSNSTKIFTSFIVNHCYYGRDCTCSITEMWFKILEKEPQMESVTILDLLLFCRQFNQRIENGEKCVIGFSLC